MPIWIKPKEIYNDLVKKSRVWHLVVAYFGYKFMYKLVANLRYYYGMIFNYLISRRIRKEKAESKY